MNYEVMEALLASSKPLPRRLWLSKAARRAYLDVLGTRLGYAGPEHWYPGPPMTSLGPFT